jgi:hypothetical protein
MKAKTVLLKSLSPGLVAKALATFDRLTLLILSICWSATLTVMIFALYTVNLAISAQRAAEEALATEPTLPTIKRTALATKEVQFMIERLQRRYPDVTVKWENNILSLNGANGGSYHQWLTAIGQVDTIYPQFHWKIQSLCVGSQCGSQNIMGVELTGEKVAFEPPQANEK